MTPFSHSTVRSARENNYSSQNRSAPPSPFPLCSASIQNSLASRSSSMVNSRHSSSSYQSTTSRLHHPRHSSSSHNSMTGQSHSGNTYSQLCPVPATTRASTTTNSLCSRPSHHGNPYHQWHHGNPRKRSSADMRDAVGENVLHFEYFVFHFVPLH